MSYKEYPYRYKYKNYKYNNNNNINLIKKNNKYYQCNQIYKHIKDNYPFIKESIVVKILGMFFENDDSFIYKIYSSINNKNDEYLLSLLEESSDILYEYSKQNEYSYKVVKNIIQLIQLNGINLENNSKNEELKQLLGELLFIKVNETIQIPKISFRLSCKMVGMFLELEIDDILNMFKYEIYFKERCKESIQVLKKSIEEEESIDNEDQIVELNTIYNTYFNY
jgi:hypothetical protein